jgi:hypothetical protein
LPDGVSSRSPSLKIVLIVEEGAELIDFEFGGSLPDLQALAEGIQW